MYLFRKKRRGLATIPVTKAFLDSKITLTEEKQKELCQRLKNGDLSVFDELAGSFYGIALYIAAQYATHRFSYREDLLAEALLGVVIALRNVSEMYDNDIRPYVMSKIQTRCSNYFRRTSHLMGGNSEKCNRANRGDHRSIRPVNAHNEFFETIADRKGGKQYKELVDDLKQVANTYRRKQIINFFIQGYSKSEIATLMSIPKSTLKHEIDELDYRYRKLLANRTQEDKDYGV